MYIFVYLQVRNWIHVWKLELENIDANDIDMVFLMKL